MQVESIELARGLKNIYLDKTQASFIDGTTGKLLYRGYNIHELAEKSTFEETAFLLFYGHLPTKKEKSDFDSALRTNRALSKEVIEIIRQVQKGSPIDVLRTVVSALSTFDPETADNSRETTLRKGIRLTAQLPTIVAAHHRIRRGESPVPPSPALGHAANFLYMLFGKEPNEKDAKLVDVDLILHAEHGSNASAFATRVAASTLADLHSAVVAGIAVLKGPLHGGAAEDVMKMATEIGTPDKADAYVRRVIESGGRIMGFGHRIYKTEDPRARHLRERAKELGERLGQPQWFQGLSNLEKAMAPYKAKGIFVNVDFYAGSIYSLLGIPSDLNISIFAMGRAPGWTLQVLEQYSDNVLIRPLLQYAGPMDLEYVPIEQRD